MDSVMRQAVFEREIKRFKNSHFGGLAIGQAFLHCRRFKTRLTGLLWL